MFSTRCAGAGAEREGENESGGDSSARSRESVRYAGELTSSASGRVGGDSNSVDRRCQRSVRGFGTRISRARTSGGYILGPRRAPRAGYESVASGDARRCGYFAIHVAMRADVLSRWSAQNDESLRK